MGKKVRFLDFATLPDFRKIPSSKEISGEDPRISPPEGTRANNSITAGRIYTGFLSAKSGDGGLVIGCVSGSETTARDKEQPDISRSTSVS